MADDLDIQKHVLRFWESKFAQLRPMKRGGGRRYYRPEDVELLRGIHHLLRSQAYTIKGVQRILRDEGAEFVKACWKAGGQIPAAGEAAGKAGSQGRRQGRVEAPETAVASAKGRRGASSGVRAGLAAGSGAVAGGARAKGRAADVAAGVSEAIGHLEEARQSLSRTRALAEEGSTARKTGKGRTAKTVPAGRGTRVTAAKGAKRS